MPRFDFGIFRDDLRPDPTGFIGVGGTLDVPILLEAYSKGMFPWTGRHPIPWFSPDPRLILQPEQVRVPRSLAKRIRNGGFELRYDTAFATVMRCCETTPRAGQPGSWITPNMHQAYGQLHAHGHAHSVEVYQDDVLVGGLYGLAIGRAFFGESMFYHQADASKVALVHLCRSLQRLGFAFIDCQQQTPHLQRMGAQAIPRSRYLERLAQAIEDPGLVGSWQELVRLPPADRVDGTTP